MDTAEILAIFDNERRTLPTPGYRKETDESISRSISGDSRWSWIDWSMHSDAEIESAIDGQLAYFGRLGAKFEWKVYDHDKPADLRQRLTARGFQVGPAEAFLVMPIRDLENSRGTALDVRRVETMEQMGDYLAVEQVAWPTDQSHSPSESIRRFLEHPEADGYHVGYADGKPVTCGRVSFREGSRFAGLFGGATLEAFRGRGIYSALVASRAAEALARGVDFFSWMPSRRAVRFSNAVAFAACLIPTLARGVWIRRSES